MNTRIGKTREMETYGRQLMKYERKGRRERKIWMKL